MFGEPDKVLSSEVEDACEQALLATRHRKNYTSPTYPWGELSVEINDEEDRGRLVAEVDTEVASLVYQYLKDAGTFERNGQQFVWHVQLPPRQ